MGRGELQNKRPHAGETVGSTREQSAWKWKGCVLFASSHPSTTSALQKIPEVQFPTCSPRCLGPTLTFPLLSFETCSNPSHANRPSRIAPFPVFPVFNLNSTTSHCTTWHPSIPLVTAAMDTSSYAPACLSCSTRSFSTLSRGHNPTLLSISGKASTAGTQNRPWAKLSAPHLTSCLIKW